MELCVQLLAKLLENQKITVNLPDFTDELFERFNTTCYQMLKEIKAIIEDDSFDDPTRFMKIEEIIDTFGQYGCSCDSWHDELV